MRIRDLGTFWRCAEFNGRGRPKEPKMKRKFKGLSVENPAAEIEMEGGQAELGGFFSDGLGYVGEMSPVWGALLGTGLASTGILVAKSMRKTRPRVAKYAGLVGLATAALPGGVALFFPKTRRAAYLGLATATIVSVGELLRSMYVEPQLGEYDIDDIGLYQPEMTDFGQGLEVLGDEDMDGFGAGIEVLGQTTPQEAMGLYQPEMTGALGAAPVDVMGSIYGGAIAGY